MARRRTVHVRGFAALGLVLAAGCSPDFHPQGCERDADCGAGMVCAETSDAPVCEAGSGVSLHVGMSAPISGNSQNLGIEMRKGISLAFTEQNERGGVHG